LEGVAGVDQHALLVNLSVRNFFSIAVELVVVDRSVAVALARAVGVVDVFFAVAGAVAAAHAFYFLLLSENLPQLWKHYK